MRFDSVRAPYPTPKSSCDEQIVTVDKVIDYARIEYVPSGRPSKQQKEVQYSSQQFVVPLTPKKLGALLVYFLGWSYVKSGDIACNRGKTNGDGGGVRGIISSAKKYLRAKPSGCFY